MHFVRKWPIASDIALEPNVGFRGTADIVRSGAPSAVANDPKRTWGPDCHMLGEWQIFVLHLRLFFRLAQTGYRSFVRPFGSNG